ncbi:hypothetical protein CHU98_g1220 [Xylaria longipes]|nr:hypothetical protein CHU98_g1220 [Xylaria longipes]
MSLPIDSTVVLTKRSNGVLMGIFINTVGEFQYYDGRVTNQMDENAWWVVPDYLKGRGVVEAGYYYVLTHRGYERRTRMVMRPGGYVAYG